MFSLEYLPFAQIITILHENFQKLFETGNGGEGEGEGEGEGGLASPARTLFSYGHPSRTTGTAETTIWQPGFIRKMETARDDYMQTRLNAGFLTSGTTGDFIDIAAVAL